MNGDRMRAISLTVPVGHDAPAQLEQTTDAAGTVLADTHLSSWAAQIEGRLAHPTARVRTERHQVISVAATVSGVLGDRACCWGTDEVTEGPTGRQLRCGRCLELLRDTTWTQVPLEHVDLDVPVFCDGDAAPAWQRVRGWAVPEAAAVARWANEGLAALFEPRCSFAAQRGQVAATATACRVGSRHDGIV